MKWIKASERLPERSYNSKPIMIKFLLEYGAQERMITVNRFLDMVETGIPVLEKIEWLDKSGQDDLVISGGATFGENEIISKIKTLLLDQSISPETFRDEVGKILKA